MADEGGEQGAAGAQALRGALRWRLIGPHRGGRVVAVAGDPVEPLVFYFGACAGGVWKTSDGGLSWANVSDGFFRTAAVGALAVAESDPNVVYAGMGETCIRGNVSHGDGVYRSTDAGRTWRHLGLAATRHIAKVRVHPRDPDLVYVAALGHAYGPNPERGVYRSRDGGRTWEHILQRDEQTGAIDLAIDPHNPRRLYAALWQAQRTPYSLSSGGPGSGICRSDDGGDTWSEIGNNPDLPTGVKGKIGLAVSPARRDRLWAIVEAADGALFRSDDAGATWQRQSEDGELRRRAWYYMHLAADPQDADTLWVLNVQFWKSVDGGASFFAMPTPHGDNHDLWIDARDPRRMIEGNDGGACVSFNGGLSWSSTFNQPTAQFYHVTADSRFPYRVYGSQQDNTALALPSRTSRAAITELEWYDPGGGESGYIAVRPDNPDIVFGGAIGSGFGHGRLLRYDHTSGQRRNITVWPEVLGMGHGARDLKYRFQWTFPLALSPHDPNVLYAAANRLFRSGDEGGNWEAISPDLSRNDVSKMAPSGGPITRDNTGAETYGTIFAFAESPRQPGLFWAGSDDGLVHLSRDGGRTWQDITPPDLPEWALISIIEASPHDPAAAYLAATRYKLDDLTPYLYKTADYGKSWRRITDGIPADDFTRVIRADPDRRGLLYAGTESGVYLSLDDGASWQPAQGNLPVVPIYDLAVHRQDLIAATHGRSFWILDDLTPWQQADAAALAAPAHLFRPRPTYRVRVASGPAAAKPGLNYRAVGPLMATYRPVKEPSGVVREDFVAAGQNPPDGVIVTYHLRERPTGPLTLTFLDEAGVIIRSFTSKPPDPGARQGEEAPADAAPGAGEATPAAGAAARGGPASGAAADQAGEPATGQAATTAEDQPAAELLEAGVEGLEPPAPEVEEDTQEPRPPAEAGTNRFAWNLRYPDARKLPGDKATEKLLAGPLALPGRYEVRLDVGGRSYRQPFELLPDPRVAAGQQDLRAQFALHLRIRDALSAAHEAVEQLRALRRQAEGWRDRLQGQEAARPAAEAAGKLVDTLTAVEGELVQVQADSPLGYPTGLNARMAILATVVDSADAAPTRQAEEVFADLAARIDAQRDRLRAVVATDVAAFNALVAQAGLPAIGLAP